MKCCAILERGLINIFGYKLNIMIGDVINNDLIRISWYKNIDVSGNFRS